MAEPLASGGRCDVAVVGGGTAGLALAAELGRLSAGRVVVLEREAEAGGVPRHCGHRTFGIAEYRWPMTGREYARRNLDAAAGHGAEVRAGASVTALRPGGALEVAESGGRYLLEADRVVLCTGVREASRAQRLIGGDRPAGVVTTGALQSLVHLKGIRPFGRPVILGSELVSLSAVGTCAHLGIRPAAMVEEGDRMLARGVFRPYLALRGVPLHTGATDPRIVGGATVEAIEFGDGAGGRRRIETDGVIVSGRFLPEAALLHAGHLEVDPNTGGPVVDQYGRCSDPAYFAAGNLLRPAESSGFCWREGVETARRVAACLRNGPPREAPAVPVVPRGPAIRYAVPQRIRPPADGPGGPDGVDRFYLGLAERVDAEVSVRGGDREYWRGRLVSGPVRRVRIPIPRAAVEDAPAEIGISLAGRGR